ncbi:MAG: 50S ribosomal protein L9 [bacterium]|nr:50S ribosomal protein L9 [bacterium]
MKIILLEDVERIGKRGDVVDVKPGYGRNYLIPKKLAFLHTDSNLRRFEEFKKIIELRNSRERRVALKLKEELESLSLTFPVQAGEDGKLFGAVTNIDIEGLLAKEGYKIDRKNVILEDPIKELGVYSIRILLHPEVEGTVKLWVVSK